MSHGASACVSYREILRRYGARCCWQAYYFRKVARYLECREHTATKHIRAKTHAQITIPELLFLRWNIRRHRPGTVVEIGSYCGATTSILAETLRQLGHGRVYALDLFSRSSGGSHHVPGYSKIFDETMQPYRGWFEKVEGDSKTIPWNQPIDVLFIDGDHSEEGVRADLIKYMPYIKPGGLVFLHDYIDVPQDNSLVKRAVDSTVLRDPAYRIMGLVSTLIGFRKIVSASR